MNGYLKNWANLGYENTADSTSDPSSSNQANLLEFEASKKILSQLNGSLALVNKHQSSDGITYEYTDDWGLENTEMTAYWGDGYLCYPIARDIADRISSRVGSREDVPALEDEKTHDAAACEIRYEYRIVLAPQNNRYS